jgi:hypothetical protein
VHSAQLNGLIITEFPEVRIARLNGDVRFSIAAEVKADLFTS